MKTCLMAMLLLALTACGGGGDTGDAERQTPPLVHCPSQPEACR